MRQKGWSGTKIICDEDFNCFLIYEKLCVEPGVCRVDASEITTLITHSPKIFKVDLNFPM